MTGEYDQLALDADALGKKLPQNLQDAWFQLLGYPIKAMANLYDMYYAQAMNLYLAANKNPDANLWAGRVRETFRRDSLLCAAYNHDIAGGKWNGMMTQKHIGYRSWNDNFRADMLPRTTPVDDNTVGGYTFTPSNGYVAMEAEHYYSATAPEGLQWTVYPYYGRTRSAVALTPYTMTSLGDAALAYRFTLPADVKSVKVHVIVKSTLDFLDAGGFEYAVSLDGGESQVVNFNKTLVDRQPYMYSEYYPAVASRVVEKVVELPVGTPTDGMHSLTLQPKHPGIVFEKIVVDAGGYQSQYLFGQESPCTKSLSFKQD